MRFKIFTSSFCGFLLGAAFGPICILLGVMICAGAWAVVFFLAAALVMMLSLLRDLIKNDIVFDDEASRVIGERLEDWT